MDEKKTIYINGDELRRRAEELVGQNRGTTHTVGTEDVQKVLHELQVHQVELEMQNAELLRTRDTLEEMLEKYSDLFNFAPVGYLILNRDGTIQSVNFTGASFLGYDRPLLLGRRFGLFVAEECRSVFADFLNMVFTSKNSKSCEVALVKKDGYAPLIVQVEAISDEAGHVCRVALVDISRIKEAENKLRENEERHRLLAETMLQGVVLQDANGTIISMNPAAERILGKSSEDFLGKTSITVGHDTVRENGEIFPGMEHPAMVALQTGKPVQGVVMGVFNPRLDEYRWINVNAVPVSRSNDACPSEVYAVFEDITERKQAVEALNKLNEELESRVEERTAELRSKDEMLLMQSRQAAMGEMIGNIAHQWRQPLNTLGLTVQSLLLIYDFGGFSREFLDESVNASMGHIQHMSKTIDDFRNYFKPDKEKVEFKLSEAIAKTLSLVEDSFKMQSISIEVITKMDPVINGYQNELAQAILNILNNARDALIEKEIKDPRVTITIFTENGRSVVTISDNAGGISEEFFEKIFDPYFTTKGPQAGTGIGLFMSKSIIEKSMNGSLIARNTATGAEFRIEV